MSNSEKEEKKPKLTKSQLRKSLRIFEYVLPYKWSFIIGFVLLVISSLVFMIFPVAAGELLNIATGKGTQGLTINQVGLVLLGVLFVQSFSSYLRVILFANISEKGMGDVRKGLYKKLLTLPITFFEQNRVGELTSRSASDIEQLQSTFSIVLAEFIRQVIILFVGVVYLLFKMPKLTFLMLATFPVIVLIGLFFGRYIRKLSKNRQSELAKTNVIIEETLQNISAVKAFTNEWFEAVRYSKTIDEVIRISLSYARVRGLFIVFIIAVLFGVIFFVLWSGAKMVESGDMLVGELVTFISLTAIIGAAISGFANMYAQIVGAVGATERIFDILDQESELEIVENKNSTMQLDGDIEYKNVAFSYPTRTDIEVLKNINLKIKAGQTIALVGASGAGKSTIVQLLMRLYPINGGEIKVNDKKIEEYNINQYRHNIAIVPQEIMLFGGTISENIAYGKFNASQEEIIEAAKQANAWEFIQGFPEGLETMVGERGVKLSGGQRQRIAIARALLRNPNILILDEATSSLDAESEQLVQDALEKLMKNRTTIIIAHRLATIKNADKIYVLNQGNIIEEGTHQSLLDEKGAYNQLIQLQMS